jgi:hypothetical protein
MAESTTGESLEFEISASLIASSENANNYVDSGFSFFKIYSSLSCPIDRVAAKPIIQAQFAAYVRYLDIDIKRANYNLASTKRPGTAAAATNFKTELRDIQAFFQAVSDGL